MTLTPQYLAAIQDFRRLRRRAGFRKIISLMSRRSGLLSYKDMRKKLHAIEMASTKLRVIPVQAIQGSVGRYADFTRDFLPADSIDEGRWARVKMKFTSLEGVPPIEVYQIGEVYFVLDGNHRVSVAREMGIENIEAYVREVKTKVPLKIDENLDQILIKAEFSEFLEKTNFDRLYPDTKIEATVPGRYINLLQQIEAVHFALELEHSKAIPFEEAVKHWFDAVYDPILEIIRTQDLLQEYPKRTETDLFLWIFKHRATLTQTLGWEITPDSAVKDLSQQPQSSLERLGNHTRQLFYKILHPRQEDTGPPPGAWRQEKMASPQGRLFGNLFVVIDGTDDGWQALSVALKIADFEGSQLFGLFVGEPESSSQEKKLIQGEFEGYCYKAGIEGQLTVATGDTIEIINERSCWADLVILPKSGISPDKAQALVMKCPIPILVVNPATQHLKRVLLAYDGSPKSEEALFLAAYVSTFWELSLTVITILESGHPHITPDTIIHAQEYLEYYGVPASYIEAYEEPTILQAATEQSTDLILLGGYCGHPRRHSSHQLLDQVLNESHQSIMVCR
jgi:nucleotide-binding universal stress UspA family protein